MPRGAKERRRIAIPWREGRISPVFDTAIRLLLVDVEGNEERGRQTAEIGRGILVDRVQKLRELKVDLLICGGVSRPLASALASAGLQDIPWMVGGVEDVLKAFLAGRLSDPGWRMPGYGEHELQPTGAMPLPHCEVTPLLTGLRSPSRDQEGSMPEQAVTLRVLVNNSAVDGQWRAEHGLAFWLDIRAGELRYRLLFDSGRSGEVLLHNASMAKLDWTMLDAIVLSHGHGDHAGGLLAALQSSRRRLPVVLHPDALLPKVKTAPALQPAGMPYGADRLHAEACVLATRDPVRLVAGVQTSGEVPRKTSFEPVRGFGVLRQGRVEPDEIFDDASLFIDLPDAGLVVITGCAHAGLINIIQHGLALTGAGRLSAIVGGFHLRDASEERLRETVAALQDLQPESLVPLHCTGERAMAVLRDAFGDRVRTAHVGSEFKFTSWQPTAP